MGDPTHTPGQARVIIESVSPEVDCGKFYAKRVLGEYFEVQCDLYADGHDVVNGTFLFKHEKQKNWTEVPLEPLENDRWRAGFQLEKQGFYLYSLEGWVDHPLNWQHELKRKLEGGLDVSVELLDGTQYLEPLIGRANKAEQQYLQKLIALCGDQAQYDQAIQEAVSEKITSLFLKYPDKNQKVDFPDEPLRVYVDRRKAGFSTWYEFFPRSAAPKKGQHGTFKDCIKLLPRIADMGFDVIYFPPVHPIGKTHRKGKNNAVTADKNDPGVPWGIGSTEGSHKDIHPELGTLEDFRKLLREAGKKGIEIALDLALQCSPDHPYVKEHPQWFKWRPDGTVQYAENPPKKYQDILPLYFETSDWENLWNELLSIPKYWNKQGVKIFRVDNPHTKPFRFWQWLIAEMKKQDPDVLFLSEAFTRPKVMDQLAKAGFSQSYTYFTWRTSKWELHNYMMELTRGPGKDYFRPNFWPNTPDINPYHLQSGNEIMFMIRYFLAATLSSNMGIYGPVYEHKVHAAFPGKEEYMDSEKYEIRHWDWSITNKLTSLIKLLNKIRRENPALQQTNNFNPCSIENDQILAYFKQSPDKQNSLLMIVNLDPQNKQSGWVQVPIWELGIKEGDAYRLTDLISGDGLTWNKEWSQIEINPQVLPFKLFKIDAR